MDQNLLATRHRARLEREAKIFPCHVNRASSIGAECELFLVYSRMNWKDAKLNSPESEMRFGEGNNQERIVMADLVKDGFDVREQQSAFTLEENGEVLVSGHIDARIVDTRGEFKGIVPIEIKSMDPNVFQSIRSWDDIVNSTKGYMHRYPAQFNLYLYANDAEWGFYILKNKSSGEWRSFVVKLDLPYVQILLDRARRINDYCMKKEYPKPTPGMDCQYCDYKHLCEIVKENEGIKMIDSPEIPKLLERRESVKELRAEYERVDKAFKELMKDGKIGEGSYSVGDFLIEARKHGKGIRYDVEKLETMKGEKK